MDDHASLARIYIVNRDGLFAQGLRSLLESRHAAEIVGMESDIAKALAAVRALKPEVVIMQESSESGRPSGLESFLEEGVAPRIVRMSLERDFGTVCEICRLPASSPAEFAEAIRGARVKEPRPGDSKSPTTSEQESRLEV
ncbi:MAG: hypothetical protein HY712_06890 [candidate division NC10 bacterium]|nr:hypothetical protein [candidate division NC10 bacterium]